MFQLNEQRVKINSVNPRAEKHGEENHLACDLKLTFTVDNTVLDAFDSDLRRALFEKPNAEDADLSDQGFEEDENYLPALRFPQMEKIGWGYEGAGYRVIIHQGMSGDKDLILINTTIDKFRFDCLQGGSVEVDLRIIAHPNAEDMGHLCELIQEVVDITLEPPSAEDRAQMELDALGEAPGEQEAA